MGPKPNFAYQKCINDNERFGGGFLLPFLTGAAISAPFWYLGGVNKGQQQYYSQPYPVYYPYPVEYTQPYPPYSSYYSYPRYK